MLPGCSILSEVFDSMAKPTSVSYSEVLLKLEWFLVRSISLHCHGVGVWFCGDHALSWCWQCGASVESLSPPTFDCSLPAAWISSALLCVARRTGVACAQFLYSVRNPRKMIEKLWRCILHLLKSFVKQQSPSVWPWFVILKCCGKTDKRKKRILTTDRQML